MIKVKDLKFDKFDFNENRRLLQVKRYCNDNNVIAIQLDLTQYPNREPVFQVLLSKSHINDYSKQNAFFTVNGVQDPKINTVYHSAYKHSSIDKQGIDKKYIPWVQSAIKLYKEVNQDLFI